jgi:hypothetical protein
VREKGWVWTAATGVSVVEAFVVEGRDIVNGKAGEVKLNDIGTGSMIVARACNERLSGSEEMPNVSRVIKSVIEGNGVLGPGGGSPGNEGTANISFDQKNTNYCYLCHSLFMRMAV